MADVSPKLWTRVQGMSYSCFGILYQHHDISMFQWLSDRPVRTAKPWHLQGGSTRIHLRRNNRRKRRRGIRIASGIINFLKVRMKNCKKSSSGNWLRPGRGLSCPRRPTVSVYHSTHVAYKHRLFLIIQPLHHSIQKAQPNS